MTNTISRPLQIAVESHLTLKSLNGLVDNKIQAIRLPGFFPKEGCHMAVNRLKNRTIEEYVNAQGIGRVGIAFFETVDNPSMFDQYFKTVHENFAANRELFAPYPSPIDLFRVNLDEVWPRGANLLRYGDSPLFAGLIRVLDPSKEILPHEDKLDRDAPELSQEAQKAQLTMNLYLQTPEEGGELELYDESLPTEQYDALRGDSYGISRERVSAPACRIKPEVGDLIMFNPSNLHSIASVKGQERITISCFIGCKGDQYSLKLWS